MRNLGSSLKFAHQQLVNNRFCSSQWNSKSNGSISMFDELKEVKYFKEITDFKSLL